MKTTFTTIIALTVLSGIVLGQTKVGQLYYKITGENTASVVPELSSFQRYNEANRPTGNIIIPQTVEIEGKTYTITSIANEAFYECSGLTSINIPNSVTSIGEYAFSRCSGLTSVSVPGSVTSIGMYAFSHCSGLTSVSIPNSVTSIEKLTFSGCSSLTSVNIPNSVTSIKRQAFYGCSNLTNINIPNSVTSIGNHAFGYSSKLTSINVDAANPSYASQNGVLYSKDKTILYAFPTGKTGEFVIPNHVKSIGDEAFYGCSGLTSINISNSVRSIGNSAFSRCSNLTGVNIPNSVTSIGMYAFSHCLGLKSINIPSSVTSIGLSAFLRCSGLTSINVDVTNPIYASQDGVLYSKDKTTLHTCPAGKMGEFVIPNHVTSIANQVFRGCTKLTSINIPNSVKSIGNFAFEDCRELKEVAVNWTTPLVITWDVFFLSPLHNTILRVPAGTVGQYRQADVWKKFGNIVKKGGKAIKVVKS